MKVKIRQAQVFVTGKKVRLAIKSHLFSKWINSLDSSFTVRRIEIQSVDTVTRNSKEEVLFLKIKANIVDSRGRFLPGIVFLRGDSVGIFILLHTPKTEYVVLIESNLPAIGERRYPQLPAGMMDKETDVIQVALREMAEETNLDPAEGVMTYLTHIYPSPGACDEMIHLILHEQTMSERKVKNLQGKKTGLAGEHEHLTLKVVELDDLCGCTSDVKAHSAYLMYLKIKKERNKHENY
ncbi:MAG: NUDIX domain-containing protein [Candidatus Pacebacteria bacterium]|nr:NUDIX domain-containing protein [Candidatus Paceibacterota bacterium]